MCQTVREHWGYWMEGAETDLVSPFSGLTQYKGVPILKQAVKMY